MNNFLMICNFGLPDSSTSDANRSVYTERVQYLA